LIVLGWNDMHGNMQKPSGLDWTFDEGVQHECASFSNANSYYGTASTVAHDCLLNPPLFPCTVFGWASLGLQSNLQQKPALAPAFD